MSTSLSASPAPSRLDSTIVRHSVTKLRPYVPGKPIEEVKRELGLAPDLEIIKLASNENVLGPSPLALAAIARRAPELWLYPDDTCFELKHALAAHWSVPTDHFVIGNGSDEIIHFLMLALLEAGDEVVFATPSFVQYQAAAMMADCAFHAVPLTSDMCHDLPAMAARINDRTKLIFVANPNNPTGTVVSTGDFETFLETIPPRCVVVMDQAYYEYVASPSSPRGIDYVMRGHNVLVLQTFSKAYALAGLRVGYGIARPELIGYLQQVRGPFNVNSLAQAAAIASLADPDQVPRAYAMNQAGKAQLEASFAAMGLDYIPTEANFIMVDTRRESKQVFQELLKCGVIVRTGDPFGMPTWLRVTIGTQPMNDRFIKSLRQVLASRSD